MGQKTHPFGFRVGITETHKSRWYAPKALFAELLVEDYKIRKFLDRRLNRTPPFAAVADIVIERTREELTVILKTARPGLVIGPKGVEIEKLQRFADIEMLLRAVNLGGLAPAADRHPLTHTLSDNHWCSGAGTTPSSL